MYHWLWRKHTRGCYFTLLFRKTAIYVWPIWWIRLCRLHSKCKAKRGKSSRIDLPSVSVKESLPHSMHYALQHGSGTIEISFLRGSGRSERVFASAVQTVLYYHLSKETRIRLVKWSVKLFLLFWGFLLFCFCFWRSVSDLCDIIKPSL